MLELVKKIAPKLVTLALVIVAAIAANALFKRWQERPWTRDGQVRADVVKIAPRVAGYIVRVAVKDNQLVSQGELLFEIDPSDYQLAVDKAEVSLDESREDVEALEAAVRAAAATVKQYEAAVTSAGGKVREAQAGITSANAATSEARAGVASAQATIAETKANLEEAQREAERAKRLADRRAGSIETAEARAAAVKAMEAQLDSAKAGLDKAQASVVRSQAGEGEARAKLVVAENDLAEAQAALVTGNADRDKAQANLGQSGEANVHIREAKVELAEAQLKLNWTKVHAPSDGYISNLYLKEGAYANAGSAQVAFVDSNSFRVHAYFQETKLRHIKPGDRAIVTLMSHRDKPMEGVVETIGNATNPPDIASTEGELGVVPQIQPTFDWVRLAQRVPVTIRLTALPEDIQLISGTTASISIEE